MKKALTLIAAAFALTACHRADTIANVTFDYSFVERGAITKSNEFKSWLPDFLVGSAPTEVDVTLTKNEVGTAVKTGQTVSIEVGCYSATATYTPTGDDNYGTFGNGCLGKLASFTIDTTITISSTTKSITLPAKFACSALVFPTDEINYIEYEGDNGWAQLPTDAGSGFNYVFVQGNSKIKLRLEAVEQTIYSNGSITLTLEDGKYYIVHLPGSETIGISFGTWTGGDYTATK